MKKVILSIFIAFGLYNFTSTLNAQGIWTPSTINGCGNSNNYIVNCMQAFEGKLYAGVGSFDGKLYSSTTGNLNSWSVVYDDTISYNVNHMAASSSGTGFLYFSTAAYGPGLPTVYRSDDGVTWTQFYVSQAGNPIQAIIAFKGLGTEDSIYVFENAPNGTIVMRAAYNSNDPLNLSSSWQKVLDFDITFSYMYATCVTIHNGALYFGTNNGSTLWKSADGVNWAQNTFVGNGFGDPGNNYLSALTSYAGHLYVGTDNYSNGAQLWSSPDDTTWTMNAPFPGFEQLATLKTIGTKLWFSLYDGSQRSHIFSSADGVNFSISDSLGFGVPGNKGGGGNFEGFGNNVYFAQENFFSGGPIAPAPTSGITEVRGGGSSTGGQIWRHCSSIGPVFTLGPDTSICSGQTVNIDVSGTPASDYQWTNGVSGPTINPVAVASQTDTYSCFITDAIGCSSGDTIKVTGLNSPTFTNVNALSQTLCQGDSVTLYNSAASNLRVNLAAQHRVVNDTIFDFAYTNDSITISGINDLASASIVSVTLDSLYHGNDGDLMIMLYAPDGSATSLSIYNGYFQQNFIGTVFSESATDFLYNGSAPFTGMFKPDGGFSSFSGPADGTWRLEVYDAYTGTIGVLKGWSIQFSVADTVLNYAWTPATGLSNSTILSPTAGPLSSVAYTGTVTNIIGCSSQLNYSLTVPTIAITTTNDSICHGTSTPLNVSGVNPVWSASSGLSSTTGLTVTASPLTNTMYYVTDTLTGCFVKDSLTIFVDPIFSPNAGGDQTICFADSVTLSGLPTGGTAPYIYSWNDGTSLFSSQNITQSPTATTTYTLDVTDGFGCLQSDVVAVNVTPSSDIRGTVSYSGGPVQFSNVVLYNYQSALGQFDTLQTVSTDASGVYVFSGFNHNNYLIEVFPSASYPTLIPTYYGDHFLWDSSSVAVHGCGIADTFNIQAVEETSFGTGPGFLHGQIVEGAGFNSFTGSGTDRAPGDPVPGIDVKLGRNPGGHMMTQGQTDSNGEYAFSNVPYGDYVVYVDIPGLGRDSSYTFTVDSANNYFYYLNYYVDSTTIYIVPNAGIGINEVAANENVLNVYPNPSNGNANIEYNLLENAEVSLGVYNVLGVELVNLVKTNQTEGKYKYSLSEKRNGLSSGVYFVVLNINGKSSIRRIIITE